MNTKLIDDAKKYVNYLLLPLDALYYHQYEHALDVMQRALYLGKKEKINKHDFELLSLAGLFHDTGFVIQYDNNEYIGAKIAKNYLKAHLYCDKKIDIVEQLILATHPDKKPKNILEKIIKDADLDNLGREDFLEKGERLKTELELIKKIRIKDPDWHHAALDFIEGHHFYTSTQIRERSIFLEMNKELLKKQLGETDGNS